VPTSTGAAKAVALVLPKLKGKLNGARPALGGRAARPAARRAPPELWERCWRAAWQHREEV